MTTSAEITQRQRRTTREALAYFDELDVVDVDFMLGRWRGSGFPTGHLMDGFLENLGWYGKEFVDAGCVHPLLFEDEHHGTFRAEPLRASMAVGSLFPLGKTQLTKRSFLALRSALSTTKPHATLRMTECRGKMSAAMHYNRLPVHDVFRKIDANTVLGLMNLKGARKPFFFVLKRVP